MEEDLHCFRASPQVEGNHAAVAAEERLGALVEARARQARVVDRLNLI